MPLTSTIDSTTVPFSISSGNVLRHTRWMVSHSLYRERSEAWFQASSGGRGTSIDPESFAMLSVLLVALGSRVSGLLGLFLHLVDGVGVLALCLFVDELAGFVDCIPDLVGVLRQQVLCLVQESHVTSLPRRFPACLGIYFAGRTLTCRCPSHPCGRRTLTPQLRLHTEHPGPDPPVRLDRGRADHPDAQRGRRHSHIRRVEQELLLGQRDGEDHHVRQPGSNHQCYPPPLVGTRHYRQHP